jgi:NDP-sugar pyrophosphorylase family protein
VLPALVLTAGLGTRFDPLTRLIAKPAAPIGGKPLVIHILEWLHREGVRDVVLNLHHRAETIASVVGDGAHLGLRVRYSWEQPLLGSAGGPRRALPLLADAGGRDEFLVVNGDTLSDFALAPLVDAHERRAADVTMAVVANPRPHDYNGLVLAPDQRVTGFVPKGQAHGSWHFIGVQVCRAPVFAGLPDGVPAETVAGIYRDRIAQGDGRIFAWRAPTSFLDVGTPADYLDAALSWTTEPEGAIDASATIGPGAHVTRSVVWDGARIGAGATIDRCIVAGGAAVPEGLDVRDAVIVPADAARPGDAARVERGVAIFPLAPDGASAGPPDHRKEHAS